jgi:hypothetical protein
VPGGSIWALVDGAAFDQPGSAGFNNFLEQSHFFRTYAQVRARKSDDGFRGRFRLWQEDAG